MFTRKRKTPQEMDFNSIKQRDVDNVLSEKQYLEIVEIENRIKKIKTK